MNIKSMIINLLNRVAKNERDISEVGNIDLSAYQNKNEKDQVNGYLGLNDLKGLNTLESLTLYNKIGGFTDLYAVASSGSGGALQSGTGLRFSASTMYFRYKILSLTASSLASGLIYNNASNMSISTIDNHSLINAIGVGIINNSGSTKSHSWYFVASGTATINTSDVLSGNGIFIKYNPTLNGGNWQYGYVSSGVTTITNSSITPSFNSLIKFRIIYNKSNNNIIYYINDVELGTLNTNITFNSSIASIFMFSCTDATDTNIERKFQPISLLLEGSYI